MERLHQRNTWSLTAVSQLLQVLEVKISKFQELKNGGYNTYTKLYNSGVAPFLEYSCAVWPCAKANEIDIIQNRAMRYFLGVHKEAPTAGSSGDMGWIKHCYSRYLCAFGSGTDCLTWKIQGWLSRYFTGTMESKGWYQDIRHLLIQLDLQYVFSERMLIDMNLVKSKLNDLMYE